MASLPIEIADLRSGRDTLVLDAISGANCCQREFLFEPLDATLVADLSLLAHEDFYASAYFDGLEARRVAWRGFHPFIVTFTDSPLRNKWSNLFSARRAEKGLGVVTTSGVQNTILPPSEMRAYCIYELAEHALAFIAGGREHHEEPYECVYDFQRVKKGIRDSMRKGRLCDVCKDWFRQNAHQLSASQLTAFEALLKGAKADMSATPSKPRVFIGSSVEGLDVARAVKSQFEYDYYVEIWNESDVFRLGTATLEALELALNTYDYAIFVFTPDDQVVRRNDQVRVARDNVIFEAGLFVGRKGRFKTFIVHPRGQEIQLPSDLHGICMATYDAKTPNRKASVGTACEEIRSAIKK